MNTAEAEEHLVAGHQTPTSSPLSPSRAKRAASMDPSIWHKVAAISGMAALGLGTYGAHVFKPQDAYYKQFGGLLTAGILAFSGTCYAVAYLEDRKYSLPAPFGGFAFIAAWGSLLF